MKRLFLLYALLTTLPTLAQTIEMHHYPSSSEARRLFDQGVERLVIAPRPIPGPATLDFPSSSHLRSLNLLVNTHIDLHVVVTAYPSRLAAARVNRLLDHIQLQVEINHCLSGDRELQRLLMIHKPTHFRLRCFTRRQVEQALRLKDQLLQQRPEHRVEILFNRS